MKFFALVLCAVVPSYAPQLQAHPGTFSQAELAAMGLSSIQVVSDHEVNSVRVHGSYPSRWGNAYPWIKGVRRLEHPGIRTQRPFYPLHTSALVRLRYSR